MAAGFGPLCETNPPAGGTPTGEPVPATPTGTPPAPGGGGGEPDRSGWITRDRFDQVNGELRALREAEDKRNREALEAQGKHEEVAKAEKAKREEAERKAERIARRAAFIGGASGKVADVEAAYALAGSLLDDLAIDDDGNAKDPKAVEGIVKTLIERHPILKIDEKKSRSFGDDRSGAAGGTPLDPSKMTSRDMISAGYAAIGEPRRRS